MIIFKKNLFTTFIYDYAVLCIIMVLYLFVNLFGTYERQFRIDDDTISHPYKQVQTIPTVVLGISNAAISLSVIIAYYIFNRERDVKYNLHQSLLGFCAAIALELLFTSVFKNSVGRYRPDFLDRCQVDFQKVEEQYKQLHFNKTLEINYYPQLFFNTSICTNEDKSVITEGRKSFPSGHSSNAFAGMTYIALFIAGKSRLCDKNGYLWKLFISLIPFILATYVAASRVSDYVHHWQDVLCGSIIGIVFACLSYFYYHPSIFSVKSNYPYQNRLQLYKKNDDIQLPLYNNENEQNIEVTK